MLQIDIDQIVMHKADQPNAVVDLLDAEGLAGQDGRDVDLLAAQAEAPARRDENFSVMEGVGQVG